MYIYMFQCVVFCTLKFKKLSSNDTSHVKYVLFECVSDALILHVCVMYCIV